MASMALCSLFYGEVWWILIEHFQFVGEDIWNSQLLQKIFKKFLKFGFYMSLQSSLNIL